MTIFIRLIFTLSLFLSFPCITKAGENVWCETDTIKANYMINGETIKQLIFIVNNISDEDIWLLFENDNSKTNYDMIRERYLRKQDDGISLFDMITDPNAIFGDWIYDINTCFLKIIKPHKLFYVIITYSDEIAAYDMIDRIRLIPMRELIKIRSFLRGVQPDNPTTYQPDCLTINMQALNRNTKICLMQHSQRNDY